MPNNLHEQPLPRAALEALERRKIVRAEMLIGLKEAKDLVAAKDVAPSKASIKSPLMTGEASRSGARVWRWLIGLVLAIGAWHGWK